MFSAGNCHLQSPPGGTYASALVVDTTDEDCHTVQTALLGCSEDCAAHIIQSGRVGNLKRIKSESAEAILDAIPDTIFTHVRGITGGQRPCGDCNKDSKDGFMGAWGDSILVKKMIEVLEKEGLSMEQFIAEANAEMQAVYQEALKSIAADK